MPTPATIRPIEPRDDPAVAAVVRDVMTEHGACGDGFAISDAEVDAMHAAYSGDRAAYWVVERDGRVQGGGGVAPLEGGDGRTAELRKMYFRPELRGTGVGAAVLSRALDAARRFGFERCYLETLASMHAARALYERTGFRRRDGPLGRTGHHGCDAWFELPLAPALAIRDARAGDAPAVRALLLAAFEGPTEADLVDALRAGDPTLRLLVAEEGGRVVGAVAVSACALADGDGSYPARILAPVATAAAARRRGVAAALVRSAIESERSERGGVCVLLGAPAYYGRFGFRRADRFGVHGDAGWPAEAFQALELAPGAFATTRGTLVLPDPWSGV